MHHLLVLCQVQYIFGVYDEMLIESVVFYVLLLYLVLKLSEDVVSSVLLI
jgi:hypothetical protein